MRFPDLFHKFNGLKAGECYLIVNGDVYDGEARPSQYLRRGFLQAVIARYPVMLPGDVTIWKPVPLPHGPLYDVPSAVARIFSGNVMSSTGTRFVSSRPRSYPTRRSGRRAQKTKLPGRGCPGLECRMRSARCPGPGFAQPAQPPLEELLLLTALRTVFNEADALRHYRGKLDGLRGGHALG